MILTAPRRRLLNDFYCWLIKSLAQTTTQTKRNQYHLGRPVLRRINSALNNVWALYQSTNSPVAYEAWEMLRRHVGMLYSEGMYLRGIMIQRSKNGRVSGRTTTKELAKLDRKEKLFTASLIAAKLSPGSRWEFLRQNLESHGASISRSTIKVTVLNFEKKLGMRIRNAVFLKQFEIWKSNRLAARSGKKRFTPVVEFRNGRFTVVTEREERELLELCGRSPNVASMPTRLARHPRSPGPNDARLSLDS